MDEYFKECVKDFKVPKGWENCSYHHDACPSFMYKNYQILVNHYNPKKRECKNAKRFCIFNDDYEELLYTDNFNEVLSFLK